MEHDRKLFKFCFLDSDIALLHTNSLENVYRTVEDGIGLVHLVIVYLDLIVELVKMQQVVMETPSGTRVKAMLRLGSETYPINAANKGTLSEQLVLMKEESMSILKDFITRHNVPNDVPDELAETSSEEDEEIPKNSHVKSKKTKLT
ncbi:hypothetical protein HS088_TW06G00079 [Tripterygium wilfordii]|uniref:Uncharacterized protein n=1 Tax=Tripterygium wilfordii TaxID=458696 RepID=A0A7J7DI50_TRIWF|nr:hypothetical protein HS088_TW06G00079 [Tripterygium wilfordii]